MKLSVRGLCNIVACIGNSAMFEYVVNEMEPCALQFSRLSPRGCLLLAKSFIPLIVCPDNRDRK